MPKHGKKYQNADKQVDAATLYAPEPGIALLKDIAFASFDETVEVPVQINGKVRSRIQIAADASKDQMTAAAMADPHVQRELAGKSVRKTVVVPGRLVNIVAG